MSRLSEKSVELNFPRELDPLIGPAFWFGLTQRQEAELGFDALTTLCGRLMAFQYKVSSHVLTRRRPGARQFKAPHEQMERLVSLGLPPQTVYYVLPDLGTTQDMAASGWRLLPRTWLLDIADLPSPLPAPTTSDGGPRSSGVHYLDLDAANGKVVMHSEPHVLRVRRAERVADSVRNTPDAQRLPHDLLWPLRDALGRWAQGVVLAGPTLP